MDAVGREIRHAARRLVRSPAFTLATVLTLTLAVGANTAIFTVVYRVVLNPLPYPDSDRLIALDYGFPARNINPGINRFAAKSIGLCVKCAQRPQFEEMTTRVKPSDLSD